MSRLFRVARISTAAAVASCLGVLAGVGIASAHIATDPAAVAAGTATTVGFLVEHGCNGSNTKQIEIKIPSGITDAKAVDKVGWTAASAGSIITFSGGSLDAATPDTFQVSFTALAAPGTVYFPIVQTCVAGDTAWIELPQAGQAEPQHPAPAVKITSGPPTSADLAPVDNGSDDAAVPVGSTTGTIGVSVSSQLPVTSAPVTSVPVTSAPVTTKADSSNTGVVVGVIVGAAIVIGGAVLLATKRKKSTPPTT
jgi:uncharacterized protein YcnI